ncbi:MAG: glutamate synthase subunit alpha, partial [Alphaproteobacteria bacterium]|nr:glutamate synthase subunit alpha [Alphaproteobacteria bacterium]
MHSQFNPGLPPAQGLYDPAKEHDACGVGFVARLDNAPSHDIIEKGLQILINLDHRGAVGADPLAGDGCGMLMQIPHEFLSQEASRLGFTLPAPGLYGVGAVFLPKDAEEQKIVRAIIAEVIAKEGQTLLGWRDVPVDNSGLGYSVKPTEPAHAQVFIARNPALASQDEFERRLYIIRKVISARVLELGAGRAKGFYQVSMSSRTLVYKGMLL